MKNKHKIILHLCAEIGSDSQPYQNAGYDVRIIGKDIGIENYKPPKNVYGIIANPPCTQFSYAKTTGTPRDMQEGMRLVKECMRVIWECQYNLAGPYSKKTSLKFWMLENPKGLLRYFLGTPVLCYSPWEYGVNYQKKTDMWGNFNIPSKTFKNKEDVMTNTEIKLALNNSIPLRGSNIFNNQTRRSMCSPAFAKAFYKVNK